MEIQHNISLKSYNTFGIDVKAKHFVQINSIEDLRQALESAEYPEKFVISGGSNLLITRDIEALVLHINMKGIRILRENEDEVVLNVMAGENWHHFVLWTLDKDYGGLENLSLIPGNTGTAPIQNIGAYGVELKDVFESCEAMEIASRKLVTFTREACEFDYRDSFFKNQGKGVFIIISVTIRLKKRNHELHTTYGAIDKELQKNGIKNPSIRDISKAVIAIRQSKLPDPKVLGNSGSFFQNPVMDKTEFLRFQKNHPEAPYYSLSANAYKVPAGWLIEQCGFKGKKFGDAGVHKNQALVLVNHGAATGAQILALAHRIQKEVESKFGIKILPEVNIVD